MNDTGLHPHQPLHLPEPGQGRWQPLRCGLVDLFHYDYEEFYFRDGRLLLRGNNGTGKSKVMALTLPFLLDGMLTPARVEPDGDAHKRMEWNLLLGGKYTDRQGYSWLEFGRRGPDGDEFFTIGCGLKAVAGRPVKSWFFTTEQRIGRDFFLVEDERSLSKERLSEAVAGRGRVHDTAAQYRRAIDERLFRLGDERYAALIGLLLQLRQPQLSKRPDPATLSRALTEALPPLDQAVLADVAEAFRNLEAEQDELRALEEGQRAVDEFLGHYRRYAAIAARRRVRELRHAHRQYEDIRLELGRNREALGATDQEQEALEQRFEGVQQQALAVEQEERTLRDSPAMRSAEALQNAEQRAEELRGLARERAELVADAQARHERYRQDQDGQQQDLVRAAREQGDVLSALTATAEAAAMGGRFRPMLSDLGLHKLGLNELGLNELDLTELGQDALGLIEQGLTEQGLTEQGQDKYGLTDLGSDGHELTEPVSSERGPAKLRPDKPQPCPPDEAAQRLLGLYEKQTQALRHLGTLNEDVAKAVAQAEQQREKWQDALSESQRLRQNQLEAQQQRLDQSAALLLAYRTYLGGLRVLSVRDTEAVLAELEPWCETLLDSNPAERELAQRRGDAQRGLLEQQTWLKQRQSSLADHIATLMDEFARLESGQALMPPQPYLRADDARADRDGAPLWQLVDFRPELDTAARAGAEAALEAAGLLDAWVLPQGVLLDPATWDTLLSPQNAVGGANLTQVLMPAVDHRNPGAAAVTDAVVERILLSVGWGESEGTAWIDGAGRWRLGPATGAWHKDSACYIGHAAREEARRQRLAVLAQALQQAQDEAAHLTDQLHDLTQRLALLDAEFAALPADRLLREAHAAEAAVGKACRAQEERIAAAQSAHESACAQQQNAEQVRNEAATDLGLPIDTAALARIGEALVDYRGECRALPNVLRAVRVARDRLQSLREQLAEAAEQLAEQSAAHAEAVELAQRAQVHRDTLRETLGADVAALEVRLAEVDRRKHEIGSERKHIEARRIELASRVGELKTKVAQGQVALQAQERERQQAIERLQAFSVEGLLQVAAPELELPAEVALWTPESAVRLARRLEQWLVNVEDDDTLWQRHQRGLHQHFTTLTAALSRHGHEASAEQQDDLFLVRIVFQSRRCGPDELAARMGSEILERRSLLDNKERELLENYLIDEVASHLQQMIAGAERQVLRMNEEIESRPTSTGMKLRIRWLPREEADGREGAAPVGLAKARERLLRQIKDAWSVEDRQAIGEFLQGRIQMARSAEEGGSLLELLERALDYRHWHYFNVERWQDGRWRPAYGPASGGERALVITLPLFAAAASHYSSAPAEAPRLIMLDEVFAGIDDDSRAKCMGLLAQFDLDVMMTSEREWGCYPDVPGLAIAQIVRRDGIDAVFVSRWLWDGRRRLRDETPTAPSTAPVGDDYSDQGDLF